MNRHACSFAISRASVPMLVELRVAMSSSTWKGSVLMVVVDEREIKIQDIPPQGTLDVASCRLQPVDRTGTPSPGEIPVVTSKIINTSTFK